MAPVLGRLAWDFSQLFISVIIGKTPQAVGRQSDPTVSWQRSPAGAASPALGSGELHGAGVGQPASWGTQSLSLTLPGLNQPL